MPHLVHFHVIFFIAKTLHYSCVVCCVVLCYCSYITDFHLNAICCLCICHTLIEFTELLTV